jgi:hypothetical protein
MMSLLPPPNHVAGSFDNQRSIVPSAPTSIPMSKTSGVNLGTPKLPEPSPIPLEHRSMVIKAGALP